MAEFRDEKKEVEEEEKLLEGVSVLDFNMLCTSVAMQNQGKWRFVENEQQQEVGVLRLWEGQVVDCFDDRGIAIESLCCPCYRFGKNMRRTALGPCFLQGALYFFLVVCALFNGAAFIVTRKRCFVYLTIAFTMSLATYLGFFRTQIRRKFNIRGSDNFTDDCIYHLICPCCTLCQESRTLEINNVQGGTWHGRGDTICIGSFGENGKAFVELNPPPKVTTHLHETNALSTCEIDIHNQC